MKREVLLVLPILLLVDLYNCQNPGDIGSVCQRDEDCHSYLACSHNVCTACVKNGVVCEPGATGFLSKCCDGTTCELIPGFNGTSVCVPNHNNCKTNADCSYGTTACLFRLGKCGFCHPNGERCTLPYDSLECCSSYCRIGMYTDGSGACADPRDYSAVPTVVNSRYNRNINVHDVNKDITISNNTYESWMPSIYRSENTPTTPTTTTEDNSWMPSIYHSENTPTTTTEDNSWMPSIYHSENTPTTTTTEAPRPCSDGSQCGINMCIDNMCTKCQYINTFCESNDDCCKSKYTNIVCAVANHKQHVVGYHIYNKKICTLEN
ncbi:hypothetical protein WIV_gp004 [Wiseana iridescent virus]|uniref:Uncharacterized protein n=1 Tax=Wiseana iridescent virus TaxID=68347 RepID=G0T530_IRV9|nr:hypothetical protein WIV_gp004 [Wiseana iridescent virus]ADO00346.1 hypothetical protein [Wiseana iridescent virus]